MARTLPVSELWALGMLAYIGVLGIDFMKGPAFGPGNIVLGSVPQLAPYQRSKRGTMGILSGISPVIAINTLSLCVIMIPNRSIMVLFLR
jgi:hypothetical protein